MSGGGPGRWAFGALALAWLCVLACECEARAQPDVRMQLALELAVVAAHEGALANLAETALVYQVLESRRTTPGARLRLLRQHSGRALGRKPCGGGNCTWSVELLRAPDSPPASIDSAWWRAAREPAWRAVQRYARGLVYGLDSWRPCPMAPYSWGYAGDLEAAARRGLSPLGCAGVEQDGFALIMRTPQ